MKTTRPGGADVPSAFPFPSFYLTYEHGPGAPGSALEPVDFPPTSRTGAFVSSSHISNPFILARQPSDPQFLPFPSFYLTYEDRHAILPRVYRNRSSPVYPSLPRLP